MSLCLCTRSLYIHTSTRIMLGLSVTLGALHFGGYGLMTVAATAAACWLASTAAAIKKHAYYYRPLVITILLVLHAMAIFNLNYICSPTDMYPYC